MSGNSYRLVDAGYSTFKQIAQGRKTIGRVCSTQLGHFLGIIGKTTVKGATEDQAFKEVVAQHCGYANYAVMASRNSAVRAVNQQKRAEARYVGDELIKGNFKPFEKLMDRALAGKADANSVGAAIGRAGKQILKGGS